MSMNVTILYMYLNTCCNTYLYVIKIVFEKKLAQDDGPSGEKIQQNFIRVFREDYFDGSKLQKKPLGRAFRALGACVVNYFSRLVINDFLLFFL